MTLAPFAPWTDPRVGDVCATSRGRSRTVRSVGYREVDGRRVAVTVAVEDAAGNLVTIAAEKWAQQCAGIVERGGRYRRGPLQGFNGRDALWDLYEELFDAVQYLRQALYERDGR